MGLAEELFNLWDEKKVGTVSLPVFSEALISLGLIPDPNFIKKLLMTLKIKGRSVEDGLDLEEWMRCF